MESVGSLPLFVTTVLGMLALGIAVWRTSVASQRHVMQLVEDSKTATRQSIEKSEAEMRQSVEKSEAETRRLIEKSETGTRQSIEKSEAETRRLIEKTETGTRQLIGDVETRLTTNFNARFGELNERMVAIEGEVRDLGARMSCLEGFARGRGTEADEPPAARNAAA